MLIAKLGYTKAASHLADNFGLFEANAFFDTEGIGKRAEYTFAVVLQRCLHEGHSVFRAKHSHAVEHFVRRDSVVCRIRRLKFCTKQNCTSLIVNCALDAGLVQAFDVGNLDASL